MATWPSSGEAYDYAAQRWQTDWLHENSQPTPAHAAAAALFVVGRCYNVLIYIHDMGPPLGRITQALRFCNLAFPGQRERFSSWERAFARRKHSPIHYQWTSQSEFGQDNGLTRNTRGGGPLQNWKGPQIFTGAQGFLPFPLPQIYTLTPGCVSAFLLVGSE